MQGSAASSTSCTAPGILVKYKVFLDVFDKKKMDTLPSHQSYDGPIDLQLGAEIPSGCIYSLISGYRPSRTTFKRTFERGSMPIHLTSFDTDFLCENEDQDPVGLHGLQGAKQDHCSQQVFPMPDQ